MWDLTPQQVAVAFGVRAATVRSWEAGRSEPRGKRREAYRRFLQGLAQRADIQPRTAVLPASRSPEGSVPPAPAPRASAPGERKPAVPGGGASPSGAVAPPPPAPVAAAVSRSRAVALVPEARWVPWMGGVAAAIGGWALMLVLLNTWLPGWAG
ncbi:hypothetical protein [Streptomyces sp. NPDC002104]